MTGTPSGVLSVESPKLGTGRAPLHERRGGLATKKRTAKKTQTKKKTAKKRASSKLTTSPKRLMTKAQKQRKSYKDAKTRAAKKRETKKKWLGYGQNIPVERLPLEHLPSFMPPLYDGAEDKVRATEIDISEEETIQRKNRFVDAMRICGNFMVARMCAGIPRNLATKWRKEDPEFSDSWDEAYEESVESLLGEAWRRAVFGTDKPVTHMGKITDTYKEYSDTLLRELLRAHAPEKFKDRVEHSTSKGQPMEVLVTKETKEDMISTLLGMVRPKETPS